MCFWKTSKNYRSSKRKRYQFSWWTSVCTKVVPPQDTVIQSLMYLGVKPQRVIKGSFFMWDILPPTAEDCVKVTSHELITKDLILQTEYQSQHRTPVTLLEVPPKVIGEHLAAYLIQYGQILGATSDNLNRR